MLYKTAYNDAELQCKEYTTEIVIKIIAEHMVIASEAQERIEKEGTVVRTLKGDVIQHPAIKVHQDSNKIISGLMEKWGARLSK